MTEPLTVGMIGHRFMGTAHANALARLPMFFPDAPAIERDVLVGRDEAALRAATDRLGFARSTTEWETVVEEVDVLYNLTPNHLHAAPSIAALEAGTHVLCEKPLADSLDAAERMRDAARESDATAGVAFNYRFIPAIQYAKALITDGKIGTIRQVRGQYLQDWLSDPSAPWSWRNSEEFAGSGSLGDLGAHTLDLARFLVRERAGDIVSVSGQLQTFVTERPLSTGEGSTESRPVDVDDAYAALTEFEHGAIGRFEASRFATGHKNDHSIVIHGSEGSIRFSLERLNELEYQGRDHRGYERILVTDESDPYIDRWWPPGHVIGWEHTFVHENYEFLSAIDRDDPFTPSFADGHRVQALLAAIERSDERGARVSV